MTLSMHLVFAQEKANQSFLNVTHSNKLEFQMYPNPYTGGELHFISNADEIKIIMIINILGEVVFQTSTYEDYVIPNILNNGIYIVKIKQGDQQGLSRLVVP